MKRMCPVTNSAGEGCKNRAGKGLCATHSYRLRRHGDVQADRPIRKYSPRPETPRVLYPGTTEAERFWRRVRQTSDHWWWQGGLRDGRTPQAMYQGFSQTARRIAWIIVNGDPGSSRVVGICGQPTCVNPSHMTIEGSISREEAA